MEKKLRVGDIIKNGIELGLKNIGPVLVNLILWILTCWIPYLNIGTTIGLTVGVIAKMAKDEPLSMTEIFNPEYRKYMGEFFLVNGLSGMGVAFGFILLLIPGFVISIAWKYASLLVVDKGKNPTEALSFSNKATYGNKATLFLAHLVFFIIISIPLGILIELNKSIGFLLAAIVGILGVFALLGIEAYCYRELCSDL